MQTRPSIEYSIINYESKEPDSLRYQRSAVELVCSALRIQLGYSVLQQKTIIYIEHIWGKFFKTPYSTAHVKHRILQQSVMLCAVYEYISYTRKLLILSNCASMYLWIEMLCVCVLLQNAVISAVFLLLLNPGISWNEPEIRFLILINYLLHFLCKYVHGTYTIFLEGVNLLYNGSSC